MVGYDFRCFRYSASAIKEIIKNETVEEILRIIEVDRNVSRRFNEHRCVMCERRKFSITMKCPTRVYRTSI